MGDRLEQDLAETDCPRGRGWGTDRSAPWRASFETSHHQDRHRPNGAPTQAPLQVARQRRAGPTGRAASGDHGDGDILGRLSGHRGGRSRSVGSRARWPSLPGRPGSGGRAPGGSRPRGARVCVIDLADEAGEEAAVAEVEGCTCTRTCERRGRGGRHVPAGGRAPRRHRRAVQQRRHRLADDVSVLDTSLEAWRRVQDVNLTAVFLCCGTASPTCWPGVGVRWSTRPVRGRDGRATHRFLYTASKGGGSPSSRELGVEFGRRGCG